MGLLSPAGLFWLLSLVVLVLIYLRSRARTTIEVSSLLLFDEAPAPVAKSRRLRLDALFWTEFAALGCLSLALAGLYLNAPAPKEHGRGNALIFDLGAAMGASDGGHTRLDTARREALSIVSSAPPDDRFAVIGYSLDA